IVGPVSRIHISHAYQIGRSQKGQQALPGRLFSGVYRSVYFLKRLVRFRFHKSKNFSDHFYSSLIYMFSAIFREMKKRLSAPARMVIEPSNPSFPKTWMCVPIPIFRLSRNRRNSSPDSLTPTQIPDWPFSISESRRSDLRFNSPFLLGMGSPWGSKPGLPK